METSIQTYVNPLSDWGFKRLFGTEMNKDLLLEFLRGLFPERDIRDIAYLKNERQNLTERERDSVFDVMCVSGDGTQFVVEMQKRSQRYFAEALAAVLPRPRPVLRRTSDNRAGPQGRLELPAESGVRGRCAGLRDGARLWRGVGEVARQAGAPVSSAGGRDWGDYEFQAGIPIFGSDYEFQAGIPIFGSGSVQEGGYGAERDSGEVDVCAEEPVAPGGAAAGVAGEGVRTAVRGGESCGVYAGGEEPV